MSSTTSPSPLADSKEIAGDTFALVSRRTRDLFPDAAYRPVLGPHGAQIVPGRHRLAVNSDGTGTKPELIERLFSATGDYRFFDRPARDVVAMVADDAARNGHFTVGIVNCVDVNSAADGQFIAALAHGMELACQQGRFPLLNGETAELGHRAPGPGSCRLNWNAVALALVNADKEFHPDNLRPGQPIVALRERTIRSNGLSRARSILEHVFLAEQGVDRIGWLACSLAARSPELAAFAGALPDLFELHPELASQVVIPWHTRFPDLTERLSRPATIYSALIHAAQGGVEGRIQVPIVACTHVTGGGIPLKVRRMLAKTGLGAQVEAVFPDPEGIPELLELAEKFPRNGHPLVDDREACEQWNRGIGFLCVLPDASAAHALQQLARDMGFEAASAGQIVATPTISFRGHEWPAL